LDDAPVFDVDVHVTHLDVDVTNLDGEDADLDREVAELLSHSGGDADTPGADARAFATGGHHRRAHAALAPGQRSASAMAEIDALFEAALGDGLQG
jgi:hypothetical protein